MKYYIKGILILVLLIPLVSAATLTGTIYDGSLNQINSAMVELNTTPQQRVISKNGTYSFSIPLGKYSLKVSYIDKFENKYVTEENITIQDNGKFNLDLFLFDEISTDILSDDITIEEDTNLNNYPLLTVGILALSLLSILYIWIKYPKKIKDIETKKLIGEDEDIIKLLSIIKKYGGRITQKNLRKEMPHSEAKVSLMITQLENEGKLKKIKKGRSNILILQ